MFRISHAFVEPDGVSTSMRHIHIGKRNVAAVLPVEAGSGQVIGALIVASAGETSGQVGGGVFDHHVAHHHVANVGGKHGFCEVGGERLALRERKGEGDG